MRIKIIIDADEPEELLEALRDPDESGLALGIEKLVNGKVDSDEYYEIMAIEVDGEEEWL